MIKPFHLILFYLIIPLFLTVGCAPKGIGPSFSINDTINKNGLATVCHYRLEKFFGSGKSFIMFCNDKQITQIGNGGYFIQSLEPGFYEFKKLDRINTGPTGLLTHALVNTLRCAKPVYSLKVEPQKKYYLRWEPTGKIEEIAENIALKELHGLKQFEAIK